MGRSGRNPQGDGHAPVRQMAVDEVGVSGESCPLDERAGFTSLKRAVPGTPPDSSAHHVPTTITIIDNEAPTSSRSR